MKLSMAGVFSIILIISVTRPALPPTAQSQSCYSVAKLSCLKHSNRIPLHRDRGCRILISTVWGF